MCTRIAHFLDLQELLDELVCHGAHDFVEQQVLVGRIQTRLDGKTSCPDHLTNDSNVLGSVLNVFELKPVLFVQFCGV